jgi:hypothetical protein
MALGLALVQPFVAESDDTYLFRVQTGKPYVYVIFDTSSSMNLSADLRTSKNDPPVWVETGAEDPLSTFYTARSAVAEVFEQAFKQHGDFIHFGFMRYSQNQLRMRGKHWMYMATSGGVSIGGTAYPATNENLTFGAHLPTDASPGSTLPIPAVGQLGSCNSPVAFDSQRAAVNRFPKLHPIDTDGDGYMDDVQATTLWLSKGGTTYRLTVSKNAASATLLNASPLAVDFTLDQMGAGCASVASQTATVSFSLIRQFFLHDLVDDVNFGIKQNLEEFDGGVWQYQDAEGTAQCGADPHPHTGEGWEGNYDGNGNALWNPTTGYPNNDPYYCNPATGFCDTLNFPTLLETNPIYPEPEVRSIDRGDQLPYHWQHTNREQFMRRLAPNYAVGTAFADLDFRIAPYFKDVPNANGFLELVNPSRMPMIPYGGSALAEALTDWRCFYLGTDEGGNKCGAEFQPFGRGWDWLAPQYDLEWGCRRPRILVISDGENNCKANDPSAGSANLKRNGVEAWVINIGPPNNKLRVLAQNTGGIYVEAADRDELIAALQNFVGAILEETKAFASAVVPTVQAEEADKIFVSNFKPLNNETVWPGDIQGFLKPVPLDANGKPNVTLPCGSGPGVDPESECFLWSTRDEMLGQVNANLAVQYGNQPEQRRLFYSRLSPNGTWPSTRRYLSPTSPTNSTAERYDLWRGFAPSGVTGVTNWSTVANGSLTEAQELEAEALVNAAIAGVMAMKTDDNQTPENVADDEEYILGDIFHSDPLIVGSPSNTRYFALNLEDDGTDCEDGNPGYRCFFRKHEKRRKVLMVGSNDGQVHAIDAGVFRTGGTFADQFDRGTGKEVFAFTPRGVMNTLWDMHGEGLDRTWTVDGPLVGFDAFIDPLDDSATFPEPDDREWRTLVIGGLREGGETFYALDVTQPDDYDSNGAPTGVNGYVPSCMDGGSGCGPIPYPAQLWEFSDAYLASSPARLIPFDTDCDGLEDMKGTWSVPNLGLMKVCNGANCDPTDPDNDLEDRHVAVFGGGLDLENATGNWLYILDVETGTPIYKRQLFDTNGTSPGGAVAGEVAAVDTDNDGYLDRIYAPTLRGFLYRVDLYGSAGQIPQLADDVDRLRGDCATEVDTQRITDDLHRPRLIFKAQPDPATPGPASRAIYYRPSVIFSAALGQYVIAVGTGDRENLWSNDGSRGVFYVFRDDIAVGDFDTLYTEADLVPIDTEVDGDTELDLLTDPTLTTKGYFLALREQERLITNPFAVSGVTVFTVFDPDVEVNFQELTCSRTGKSRIFGVTTTNGNGLLFDEGERVRAFTIADFVTEPYIEPSATKNPGNEGNEGGNADDLSADHIAIMEELKKLFPSNCKFANYRLDVKTLSSDTGIHMIAPIPICIVEKNWKEY